MSQKENKQSEEGVEKPGWTAFWIYTVLIIISIASMYPLFVEQAVISIEAFDIEETSAEMMGFLYTIQPFVIAMVALLVGHFFSYKIGLRSLLYEKFDQEKKIAEDLKDSLPCALVLGAVIGAVAIGFDVVFRPYLPEVLQTPVSMPRFIQSVSSILYGGITEEIMLRWGFMTIVAYVISVKGELIRNWVFWTSILLSALVFALGHYPVTADYLDMTPLIWIRMLALNGLGGVIFGWLYWKHHLEAAILSHMFAHVTMTVLMILFATLGI